MTTTLALLGVVTAMLAVQGLIILAHSLQNRMGTMPLGVITGACMFSVWMYAEVAPVLHITENITIHLLAIIVYTNLLSALLMALYMRWNELRSPFTRSSVSNSFVGIALSKESFIYPIELIQSQRSIHYRKDILHKVGR